MIKYKESLPDGNHLEGSIELLNNTRQIINVFRDLRPVIDMNDDRLEKLSNCDKWLMNWSHSLDNLEGQENEKSKLFVTKETSTDTISMLRGFKEICKTRIEKTSEKCCPCWN